MSGPMGGMDLYIVMCLPIYGHASGPMGGLGPFIVMRLDQWNAWIHCDIYIIDPPMASGPMDPDPDDVIPMT